MRVVLPFLLLLLAFNAMPCRADAPERHVRLELLTDRASIAPNGQADLVIRQTIAPGWHTYWTNPGDAGQAMRVTWHLPAGFAISPARWPAPRTITVGGIESFGYQDTASTVFTLHAPDHLPASPPTIKADVETLVCSSICVPEYDHLSYTFDAGKAASPAAIDAARRALPLPVTGRMEGAGDISVALGDLGSRFDPARPVAVLPFEWGSIDAHARVGTRVADGRFILTLTPGVKPAASPHILMTQGAAAFDVAPGAADATPAAVRTPSIFAARNVASLPAALLLALLGGLILNLMPCVFPVLSLKAISLARMGDVERGRALRHGLAYTAGILVCFCGIAIALLVLKGAGAQIGWGFQLQTPQVVLALAWLLFAIGLSFSGLFEIGAGLMNTGDHLTRKEGALGSFCTGLLAAVVATPCTAPFMAAAVGYALVQPAPIAVAIFMTLGLGLALPYLLICLSPPLRRLLPKPGRWMVALKEFLAFPMYGSSAWLVWVYTLQTGPDGVLYALSGMVLLALIVWATVHLPGRSNGRCARRGAVYTVAAVSLTALLLVAWIANVADRALVRGRVMQGPPVAQSPEKFTPETLKAVLAGPDPVFVDMTAAWCITCKINEKVALGQASVKADFRDRHVRLIVGDWTNQDAAITAYLQSFGRQGVPLYIFYGAPGADGKRPQPVVLPQILTPNEIRKVLDQ